MIQFKNYTKNLLKVQESANCSFEQELAHLCIHKCSRQCTVNTKQTNIKNIGRS